ncbi:SsrA-binding protein SmpB [Buchnera aphidicola]|uniref:SsrA-binding protein SmpB n=1 Tax=Buchnera aphidicola TaxID=9 RepID=UPI00107C4EA5|nr:SsrA-binding protein SmpB [Buchnera aphidicola]VFP79174.1 SsrA-binding protein [Buchnera aphidicola (Cinara curtihirsuta)]
MNINRKKKITKKKTFLNKKAKYNFHIKKTIISGIILKGWEVKSIRLGFVQITEGHIYIKKNEAYLSGVYFQPLLNTSDFISCQSNRIRKLLLKKKEIHDLYIYSKRKGYTIIPIKLFWSRSWCKVKIGIVKGKSIQDKRLDKKNNSWKIEQSTIFKRISINK